MKFTTADGKQVKSEEEKNQDAVDSVMPSQTPSSTDGEISKNAMTFHGDTTQIDVRKGKPITLQESFEQDQASQQKKRHGCFFRGCMTVLGLLLLLILFLVGTVRALKKKATPYLGEAALPLPEVSVDTQTVANTQMTLEYIQGNQPIPASTEQLVLSKDDINQYIANYQLTHNLPGQVYVNFPVENSAVVYGTVPLTKFTVGIFKDKWLNVIVQFTGTYHDNLVDAQIVKILLDDKDVTELYRTSVGTLRINQPDDPEIRSSLERFEKIYIKDNKLYFDLK